VTASASATSRASSGSIARATNVPVIARVLERSAPGVTIAPRTNASTTSSSRPPNASRRTASRSETAVAAARVAAKTRYRVSRFAARARTGHRASERRERINESAFAYGEKTSGTVFLYYFGARYYDPRTALWVSPDPILADYLGGSPNGGMYGPSNLGLYTYSWNSPIRLRDPDGRCPTDAGVCEVKDFSYEAAADQLIGMVPIVGPLRDGYRDIRDGNVGGVVVDAAFLAADLYDAGSAIRGTLTAGRIAARGGASIVGREVRAVAAAESRAAASAERAAGEQAAAAAATAPRRVVTGHPAAAEGGTTLHRTGSAPESAADLAADAARSQQNGFPHGVSVNTNPAQLPSIPGRPGTASATRTAFENAGFPVHHTPTQPIRGRGGAITGYGNPGHHTVELPHPVTPQVADRFNAVLRR
jgi:RHS repeat-associated protein